jgi:hypothetical protein
VQNLSINGRVFFLEEGHKYYHEDDAGQYSFTFENRYAFRSPTGLIKDFHEEFDTIPEAKKYDTSQALHYVGAACFAWDMLGDMASLRGQPARLR